MERRRVTALTPGQTLDSLLRRRIVDKLTLRRTSIAGRPRWTATSR